MAASAEHVNEVGARLEQNGQQGAQLSQFTGDYRERAPSGVLQSTVRCIWRNAVRPTSRPLLVVPDGCIDLIWTENSLFIAGPDTGPVIEDVSPGATIVGIRFRPGAALDWLKVSADEIADRRLPLADLWGRRSNLLEEQLSESATPDDAATVLERFLAAQVPGAVSSDLTPQNLRRALEERVRSPEPRVRDLAADIGLSERTIRRRSRELFGYGPKTFVRILRFQQFMACVRRADQLSLAALAGLCGYADQAHLSREVRRLSGLTPRTLVAQLAAPKKPGLASQPQRRGKFDRR